MPRSARAATGLLLLLSAWLLCACGADDGATKASATSGRSSSMVVAAAFGADHPITSGRIDVSLRVTAKGTGNASKPGALHVRGPFEVADDGALPRFHLDLDVDTGGAKVSAGAISTGTGVWLTYSGTAYAVPASTVAQIKDAYEKAEKKSADSSKRSGDASEGLSLATLGIDPKSWLKDTRTVGEETVGGTQTSHIAADVDVAALLDDVAAIATKTTAQTKALNGLTGSLPTTLSASDRKAIEQSISSATLDLWVGSDDILRRMRVVVAFDVPADAQPRANGLQSGSLILDVAISDVNEDQAIEAPADARPFSELQPLLSGLLGA